MSTKPILSKTVTVTFEQFWKWLLSHPNCIVRAGTPEAMLFDDDDYHWHFGQEDDGAHLVQLIRGKKLVGELVISPADVTYVQIEAVTPPGPEEEVRFDLISETTSDRIAAYTFVLSHDYDEEERVTPGRWTH